MNDLRLSPPLLALLVLMFAVHGAVTAHALWHVGFMGIFTQGLGSPGAQQVFSDLGMALLLCCMWLVPDMKRKGIPAWPWLLAMLALGAFSPMAYVAWQAWRGRRGVVPAGQAA